MKRWEWPWGAMSVGVGLCLFHLAVMGPYGFHGDELYFLVCGQRLDWGYVDHPPLVPVLARVCVAVFGLNVWAFRLPLAVALGVSCALTGWLARRLGAGRHGEVLAAVCFAFAPLMLRFGAFLNIPCFEVLLWLIVAHLLVSIEQRDDARGWLLVGLVAGVALLKKHTTLFLGTGLAVGLLLSPRRKDLATPWPWAGGALALLIFLPNLVWQARHDWATLEFVRWINASIMQQMSTVEFVASQVILMNAFNAVVWGAGLWFFLGSRAGARYRLVGWAMLVVIVIMLALKAKVYYLAPVYPILFAGGAVLLGGGGEPAGRRRYFRYVLPVGIVAMGALLAPIFTPVGSIEWKEQYISRVLGFMVEDPSDLTFDFRNQLYREEELKAIAAVYVGLSEAERADCAVLTDEYDTASAVNTLGRPLGLPEGISGNNSYYLWGPGKATGRCVLAVGLEEAFLRQQFREVSVGGYAPSQRRGAGPEDRPIYVCRESVGPLAEIWARFKSYH